MSLSLWRNEYLKRKQVESTLNFWRTNVTHWIFAFFYQPVFWPLGVQVVLVLIKIYTHTQIRWIIYALTWIWWHLFITPIARIEFSCHTCLFLLLVYHTRVPYRVIISHWSVFMCSLSHAPVAFMPLPVVLSTLTPPLNMQPCCLLSDGASPHICHSFAGWLSRRMLSPASTSRHRSSRSHLTSPSSTPLLRLRQLVVALHLFAPPLPLDVLPPHDLTRRHSWSLTINFYSCILLSLSTITLIR